MTITKTTPSGRIGIRHINRDDPYGLLIMRLNWGLRDDYPESIAATYDMWNDWLIRQNKEDNVQINTRKRYLHR